MSVKRLSLGKWGEEAAARYLSRRGFKLVERNYTCPLGEIDLIVRWKDRLVLVEVKTKTSPDPPAPRYSVNRRKQRQIIRTAAYYLKSRGLSDISCRFDVVEVIAGKGKRPEKIVHLPGAFRV